MQHRHDTSLHSKRFQSSFLAKFRAGAKKMDGGRGGEKEGEGGPFLPSPSPSSSFFLLLSQLDKLARNRLLAG